MSSFHRRHHNIFESNVPVASLPEPRYNDNTHNTRTDRNPLPLLRVKKCVMISQSEVFFGRRLTVKKICDTWGPPPNTKGAKACKGWLKNTKIKIKLSFTFSSTDDMRRARLLLCKCKCKNAVLFVRSVRVRVNMCAWVR